MEPWDLQALLKKKIDEKGGIISCHAHFDKSHVVTKETLDMCLDNMEVKWDLWKDVKKNYTHEDLVLRMSICVEKMIAQGSPITRTNVDVDSTVGMMCVEALLEVKEKYADKIQVQICSQVLEGALTDGARQYIEKAAPYVDALGGLPSRDRPREEEHMEFLFDMAKKYGKTIDVHIDQNNDPDERDTEMLARIVIKHGMQGRVNAVHACSLAAQSDEYINMVAALLKEAEMNVIVCPRAMIDGVQLRHKIAPVHNSIAPVTHLLDAGVNVALGVDNVYDYFCPFIDGNVFEELLFLIETCRFYDIEALVNMATVNARKIVIDQVAATSHLSQPKT
ncbi:MAG: amidohydrolase family protein [Candidatus Peregrinibacteria bacterium]|nr:amidohydrolase family protein [Candidatus Peregrinibacteria bacterium]MDZ4244898.1 amidohydrolase family protein [Candidatus Gracilibacteria bacterium]